MTETVSSIQALQASIDASIWAELGKNNFDFDHPTVKQLNKDYDLTIQTLLTLLGEDAPVGQIDMGTATTYSTLYKDRTGCRPSGNTSYKAAKAYIASCKDSDLEDVTDDELLEEAESLTKAQDGRDRSDDHQLLNWQQQAGRFSNVSERHILEY